MERVTFWTRSPPPLPSSLSSPSVKTVTLYYHDNSVVTLCVILHKVAHYWYYCYPLWTMNWKIGHPVCFTIEVTLYALQLQSPCSAEDSSQTRRGHSRSSHPHKSNHGSKTAGALSTDIWLPYFSWSSHNLANCGWTQVQQIAGRRWTVFYPQINKPPNKPT